MTGAHEPEPGSTGVCVAALYRFATLVEPETFRQPILDRCQLTGIKGTVLLAHEGINGTVAGSMEAVHSLISYLRELPGCAELDVKFSHAAEMPFYRTKVMVKREIVTLGLDGIDPQREVGTYVDASEWNALISDPDTLVIDTRNDYEVGIGTFAGAVDPQTETFREFPEWFRQHRDELLEGKKRVAMFCTGGIRCEKSTAFLKQEGVNEVYHLDGGILRYLEIVPASESLWEGECFVFDHRVSVGHGLELGTYGRCHACRDPLSETDMAHPHYVEGVSCSHCFGDHDAKRMEGFAERQRQIALAAKRGEAHVGVSRPPRGAGKKQSKS
jgi:UPF0176 protein